MASCLASAGADRAVKVWDAATGKRLYTLSDPTDWVYCLAWSPDKKHLAAGGVDRTIRVWEADKDGGKLVHSAFAHEKPVWRLGYSGCRRRRSTRSAKIASSSRGTATMIEKKVYDRAAGLDPRSRHRPGGKQLAVARFDGVAASSIPRPASPPPSFFRRSPSHRAWQTSLPGSFRSAGRHRSSSPERTSISRPTITTSRADVAVAISDRSSGSLTLSVERRRVMDSWASWNSRSRGRPANPRR